MTHRTRRLTRRLCAFSLGTILVLGLSSVHADSFWQPDKPAKTLDNTVEYQQYMRLGDAYAVKAGTYLARTRQQRGARLRRARRTKQYRYDARRALEGYEKAVALRPNSAEAHYRAAEILNAHWLEREINSPVMRDRDEARRALDHWRRFEQLAPLDPRVQATLFNRAIVHTKMATEEDYKSAIRQYTTLLERADLDAEMAGNSTVWLGNLAETYMMIGDLERAIVTFRRTVEMSNKPSNAYGFAVALDRDEQGMLARAILRNVGARGLRRLATDKSIFFVPRGERFYYLALGYDALDQFDLAIEYYQRFIKSGAHPRYQPRAHDNLAWVKKRKKQHDARVRKAASKLPPMPRGLNL